MIFLGVTAVAGAFCLFFNRYLPTVDIICACWTGLGIIVIFICLFAEAAVGCRPISFMLGNFDPSLSGWTPGWSFFTGLLPVLLGLIYLGSSAAFNAFAGVAVMCLGASYAMPVTISLMNAQKDMHDALNLP
ncbi:hypothetical protein EDB19DRAFT_1916660 [Suillus lakei]|nr:hypothetical protein EDB19DRAFT_1916660 [Suillus lakei]